MPTDKEVELQIKDVLANLIRASLIVAGERRHMSEEEEQKVVDLTKQGILNNGQGTSDLVEAVGAFVGYSTENGILYVRMEGPVHDFLVFKKKIIFYDFHPDNQPSLWTLTRPQLTHDISSIDQFVEEMMLQDNEYLKTRFTQTRTMQEYKALLEQKTDS